MERKEIILLSYFLIIILPFMPSYRRGCLLLSEGNVGVPPASPLLLPLRKAPFFSYNILLCLEITAGICVSLDTQGLWQRQTKFSGKQLINHGPGNAAAGKERQTFWLYYIQSQIEGVLV